MRCVNCHTVVDETDPFCPTCRKPVTVGKRKMPMNATVSKYALIFMVIGTGVFNVLAPRWFPRPTDGGINMQQCLWAAIVGAICAVLGGFVGVLADPPVSK